MSRLERRYRRLLLCYPRAYRRARADEIVSTLLELAPPERTRPTWREAVDLLGQGMRARLGRPASRTVVVWAGLTAILCGLFAGAAGTRIGWETARPLPPETQVRALFTDVVPGHRLDYFQLDDGLFSVMGREVSVTDVGFLFGLNTGLHQTSAALAGARGSSPIEFEETLRTARERLSAAGWDVRPVLSLDVNGCARCGRHGDPPRFKLFATLDDSVLALELQQPDDGTASYMSLHLSRATPWTVYPAGISLGLLGLVFGWMVFGWASRRTDGRPAVRALAALPFGLALLVWAGIIAYGMLKEVRRHAGDPMPRWEPMWEWLGLPDLLQFFHFGAACMLAALALAALPRLRGNEARRGVPA